MHAEPLTDFSRLCIHTITTKPWSLEEVVANFSREEVAGISVWRDALDGRDIRDSGELIRKSGLEIVALVRGGFFPALSQEERQKAIQSNRVMIDEARELGAPLLVLVCGAIAGLPLDEARSQIRDGIAALLPHAEAQGIKLAVEPLHPMYADSRSAINTMRQANDLCEDLASGNLGVAVDVYHLWWDPELKGEIERCGKNGKIFAFHISDWRTPTEDILLDRGLMGEGCIPLKKIRGWVEAAGFWGYNEVEIFSTRWWASEQRGFLKKIQAAYLKAS